ncbi:MAG: hypothetical protein [Arizlama microvirus]|nr:MAG: hypothetical protein [Arizlama microvirus]
MGFRKKMNSGRSKKLFTRTAGSNHVHPKNNIVTYGPRGGIRF